MRTSFDLPDPLLDRAKKLAHRRGVPLRDLVEEGLQMVIAAAGKKPAKPFKLDFPTFGGGGFADGVDPANWEQIRGLIYGDRE